MIGREKNKMVGVGFAKVKYIGHQEEKYAVDTATGHSYMMRRGKAVEVPESLADGLVKTSPDEFERED